jgi:hypothetical protein
VFPESAESNRKIVFPVKALNKEKPAKSVKYEIS